ncbi:ABC transporter permease [Nocardioides silvaticus]|nr:ABC transporter permease [Nocardioides silvaticus]
MAEPAVTPQADVPTTDAPTEGRRLGREALLMLVVPPVVVLVVFGAWVWWWQTAELDVIESNQLRWSEVSTLIVQHMKLTVVTAVIVVVIAVPLGVILTRRAFRAAAPVVVGIANAGQAAPSVGLIVLLFLWLNDWLSGFWIAVVALSLYGILPVLRNTITGIDGVDPTLVEAGRGVGMTTMGTLFRIELQLALPVIMAGVRTSLVLVVGTASLACFINAGGLGEMIVTGITLFKYSLMISGALLVALLALVFEWLGRVLEQLTRPRGV